MSDKKHQLNIVSSGMRNQASSFIVDLRQKTKQGLEQKIDKAEAQTISAKVDLEKIKNKIKQDIGREVEYFKKKTEKIKPNLLKLSSPRIRFSFSFWRLFSSFWSDLDIFDYSIFKNKQSNWLKIFKERAYFYRTAAKLDIKSLRRVAMSEKTIPAETKVVWYRSVLAFVVVLFLIILPLKLLSYFEFFDLGRLENKILGRSQLAFSNLMAATDAITKLDWQTASSDFLQAGGDFLAAQEELNKINDSIFSLVALSNDPKLKLAAESKKFLRIGALASSLGNNLVLATDSLFGENNKNFSAMLDGFSYYGELAVIDAKNLKKEIDKINPENLPVQYQDKFSDISQQAGLLANNLETFVGAGTKLKNFLGASQDKRYLFVFQNNSELRASGGFLGSYALVDVRDGKIRNLEVPGGGSYDTEGGMNVRVVAPKPLWLVNPLWHFWDANWWPDWPTTAKNLMWFYEKSDGPTVDGVISVTPTVVEGLLEITGPIDLTKEYGLTIDANNFWETVQKIVEHDNIIKTNPEALAGIPASSTVLASNLPLKQNLEVNSANKPKKIIGDLMTKILEILPQKLSQDNLIKILALFESSLNEKQVLFYFTDPSLQAEVAKHNFAGEVRPTSRDYLLVVNTNIAGQKSDRQMTEKIEHFSQVNSAGVIVNTVKITRTHNGIKNEPLTGVRNVDWLRVYVPLGSELLAVEGFGAPDEKYFNEKPDASWEENELVKQENLAAVDKNSGTKIYNENNKTVFANWLMVDPGESAVVILKYRLPFNFLDNLPEDNWLTKINNLLNPEQGDLIPYSLMVQKQPGAKPSIFSSSFVMPSAWSVFWRYPENLSGEQGWNVNDKLDADKYWSILVEK